MGFAFVPADPALPRLMAQYVNRQIRGEPSRPATPSRCPGRKAR